MKFYKNILKLCAVALLASPFTGCKEEDYVKPSALITESSLTFEAKDAEPQSLTIASDAYWMVDVDADWVLVDPMSGTNTVKVTVTVDDNVANGALAAPRQATITIANKRGYKVTAVIYQKGDTYLGVDEYDLDEVSKLDADTRAKVKESQVVAIASDGFVAADATKTLYILGNAANVKVGDKVTMNGVASVTSGVKTFTSDEVTVLSNSAVTYPDAKDITSSYASYKPESIEYVQVAGTLINKGIRVGSTLNAVTLYNPGVDIDAVNMHKVVAHGYAILGTGSTVYLVPVEFKDNGVDEELSFYPVKYQVRKTPINFSTTSFKVEGKVEPIEGLGYIQYVPFDLANTNDANKYALDVSDSSPRVTGPWPGDYWLFYCYGAVKAGSEMRITFEARTSATGHKYWIIEYLDGENWKPAMDTKTATDVKDCVYTHAMNSDGKTNVQVDATVTIKKNMDNCQFRFRCVSNWSADGSGALATRNGGSARLTVTDTGTDEYQPKVTMVKEGDGVEIPDTDPVYATIVSSRDVLAFEGTPATPIKFTVTSDYDFTLTPSADWISLDVTSGSAKEEKEITVTCEPSTLATLRQAEITIKSEDTKKTIYVVQSAAGGELDPLISISSGNSVTVLGQGEEFEAKVQSNVVYETEINGDWISVVPEASTAAIVETKTLKFKAAPNLTGEARIGTIRFHKDNIESVLTVKQDKFEPKITVQMPGVNTIAGIGESRNATIVSNVPFTVSAPSWITVPATTVPAAGTYPVAITFAANTGDARTDEIVFTNEEYNYTLKVAVSQAASNVVFFDDFGWLTPVLEQYTAATGNKIGDTIGNKKDDNAVNIYSDALSSYAPAALAAAGYVDMNPSLQLVYLQDKYLKISKTGGNNTSLRLPTLAVKSATDVTMEFDHAAMVQGSGAVDDSKVVIVIEGDGEFENGTKYSDPLEINQPKSTYCWTHSSVKMKGISSNTRLVVVMYRVLVKDDAGNYTGAYNYKVSGAGRIFIDNIKITK